MTKAKKNKQTKPAKQTEPKSYAAIMRMKFVWLPAFKSPTEEVIWAVKLVPFMGFPSQKDLTEAVQYYCYKYGISKADAVDQNEPIPEEDKQMMQNIIDYQQAYHDDNFKISEDKLNTEMEKI